MDTHSHTQACALQGMLAHLARVSYCLHICMLNNSSCACLHTSRCACGLSTTGLEMVFAAL